MLDAAERLVNLALFLASTPRYVTAAQCRTAGLGYPEGQDEAAFLRMFERDKDALRAAGLVIDISSDDDTEAYRMDPDATYARPIELAPEDLSALLAVAAALSEDRDFPFSSDLALAVGKLGASRHEGPAAATEQAVGLPPEQALNARALAEAVQMRKTVTFEYTNSSGDTRARAVDPYGVFFREGLWYVTGRDRDVDAIRTFAIPRMRELDVNPMSPRTPDFERPGNFDVREHERLPFQYGPVPVPVRVRFEPDAAWRAERLARGRGSIQTLGDGSVVWDVEAADLDRLACWLIDQGEGIHPVDPPELITALRAGLRKVVAEHG
ncbi:MAG: WYL domain-containing protein [Coriobacteriia bacterium]|nr:WYL domain-containing protein [Coriobacteriia bacterium]